MYSLSIGLVKRLATLCAFLGLFFTSQTAHAQCDTSKAALSAVSTTFCPNQSVTFANNSSGTPNSYLWRWGDGNTTAASSKANESHTYSTAGNYTVWLVRIFASCRDSVSQTIAINSVPTGTPDFSFSPSTPCSGSSVSFTDQSSLSSGTTWSYEWDFGDGQKSTVKSPNHIFVSYGTGTQTFKVKLKVTSANGCGVYYDSSNITVNQAPEPVVSDTCNPFNPFTNCNANFSSPSFPVCLKNSTTGAVSYTIDWGDGSSTYTANSSFTGVNHTYTKLGVFDLKITATGSNGCSTIKVIQVIHESNPSVGVSSPGNTQGCAPQSIWFKLNAQKVSPSTKFIWDFGDGSPTVTWDYTKSQDSILHVFTENSCTKSPTGSGCTDCYVVSVKAANYCDTTTATVNNIKIYSRPKADFTVPDTIVCVNSTNLQFTNKSTTKTGVGCTGINLYKWDFGDGGSSTDENPKHIFTKTGTFDVQLIATNSCGSDTIVKKIYVDTIPLAAYSFTTNPASGCGPLTASFKNLTTKGLKNTYSWSITPSTGWSYTKGNSSSKEVDVEFTGSGTYYVKLTATNKCGNTTLTDSVLVKTKPVVTLASVSDGCSPVSITPSATFNDGGSAITAYSWKLTGGSPSTSSSQNPGSVTYSSTGTYTVEVSATNACGTTTVFKTFNVYSYPNAITGKDTTICSGTPLTIGGIAVSGNTYSWTSSPSGFNSSSANPSVTPTTTTSYILTETTSQGCKKTDTIKVTVNAPPTVSVGNNESVCISVSPFNLSGYSPSGGYWKGTGITDTAQGTFNPTTAGAGTHTLTYFYKDATTGCSGIAQKTVKVNSLPTVSTKTNDTLCNTSGTATLSASPSGGVWKGSNVTQAGVFSPSSAGIGTHKVTYVYADANGCSDSATKTIEVISPQTADAGKDDTLCLDAGDLTLSGKPTGGSWSGTGVSGGKFSTSTAGAGTHSLVYTYGTGTCQSTDTMAVLVRALPSLSLGGNKSYCISAADFVLSGYTPTGGIWKGTGITDTLQGKFSPSIAGAGTHTVTYFYKDTATGCSNSGQITITVNSLPTVSTKAQDTVCNTSGTITFTATPSSGGVWKGTGITQAGVFSPSTAGVGTHRLIYLYTDANGCSDSAVKTVEIVSPTTIAAGSNDTACLNDATFNLKGFSPSGGVWSGKGVNASGLFDPANAGTGTHTLTYTIGATTCQVSATKVVVVKPLPAVSAGNPVNACESDSLIQLSGFSPAKGTWTGKGIVDGTKGIFSPTVAGQGSYYLTYTFQDSVTKCFNSDSVLATVSPLPQPAFTVDTFLCEGVATPFTNTSQNATYYFWNFGDGQTSIATSLSHSYSKEGRYTIMLVAISGQGCRDTAYQTVRVGKTPFAHFKRSPDFGPGPLTVSFTDSSKGEIQAYKWMFGNGTTSNLPNPADVIYPENPERDTTYYIELEVSNRCGKSIHRDLVTVFPLPKARFGTDRNDDCSPLTIQFSNKSIGRPKNYFWDFGNGQTSTQEHPAPQVYTTDSVVKTYTITLAVSNDYGQDTVQWTITVRPNTVTAFFNPSTTQGCAPLSVDVEDFSKGGTYVSYDFGDGNIIAVPDTTHIYTQPGTYTIRQFVNDGCSFDTARIDVVVYPQAFVSFTANPACAGDSMAFVNLSQDVSDVDWDFGDSTTSVLFNPKHAYKKPGKYIVTLQVKSKTYGCFSTFRDTVEVLPYPVADFQPNPDNGCRPLTVSFQNNSQHAAYYLWDFGTGDQSTSPNPSYTFKDSGLFTIKLTAFSSLGCDISTTKSVRIYPYPVAQFNYSATDSCNGPQTLTFTNLSTGANSYEWDFGNVETSTATNPTATYTDTGTYHIRLIAFNPFQCTDTSYLSYTIYHVPQADFEIATTSGCNPLAVSFNNTSTYGKSYEWNFGDGSATDTARNPVHTYAQSGRFTVRLITKGGGGCKDTIVKENLIEVWPKPQAGMTFNVHRNPVTGWVDFTDNSLSNDTANSPLSYAWIFRDGDTSFDRYASFRYPNSGPKTVTHIVSNSYGCSDTVIASFDIEYFDGLYVPNVLRLNGANHWEETVFLPKGSGLKEYHAQVFDQWGELVWESRTLKDGQPADAWDGSKGGRPVPVGAYIWKIQAVFENGDVWPGVEENGKFRKVGTVTVLK